MGGRRIAKGYMLVLGCVLLDPCPVSVSYPESSFADALADESPEQGAHFVWFRISSGVASLHGQHFKRDTVPIRGHRGSRFDTARF